ncbi:MAG: nuiA [Phycisphaerales bacterium]|nr:nuiA [Phycisphaerales bacterium]
MGQDHPTHPMPAPDPLQPLREAGDGLLYPSESDALFEVFRWPAKAGMSAREAVAARTEGEPVDEQTIDAFFAPLADTDDAARFARLRQAVERSLTDPTVIRVGEVRVAIYLIGRAPSGEWAGLRTEAVET